MRNNEGQKFRHELKYIISEYEKEVVAGGLRNVMQSDPNAYNGRYFIRSLYFDDMWESAYSEKNMGVNSRKKYRLRIYNHDDALIRLECKRKEGNYINKISAKINRDEAQRLINGDTGFLLKRDEQVCHDFYIENLLNRMSPKVIVDYDREPYVFLYGDVRITFDSHVRAGISSDDIFDEKIPVMEVLEPHQLIMEVKFTEYLPGVIRDLLQVEEGICVAASKYVMCVEKQKEFVV